MNDTDHPWLRRDTIYTMDDEGLLIANANHSFVIQDLPDAYNFFRRMVLLCDGRVNVRQIRQALSPRTWKVVANLFNVLADRGFIRWIPESDIRTLSKTLSKQFSDQIAFLAQFIDSPHQAFKIFNEARILVLGNGAIASAITENLIDNGAGHVTLQLHHSNNQVSPYDLVVVCPEALSCYPNYLKSNGRSMIICPFDNYICALPVRWADTDVDWHAGNRSLLRGRFAEAWNTAFTAARNSEVSWQDSTSAESVQRLFGSLLAYEIFKGLTHGLPAETGHNIFTFNVMTGETYVHPVTPILESARNDQTIHVVTNSESKLGLSHEIFRACTTTWIDSELADCTSPKLDISDSRADEYAEAWESLIDSFTTPAFSFEDGQLIQVPMKITLLKTPFGLFPGSSAWSVADARIDVIARAYGLLYARELYTITGHMPYVGIGRSRLEAVRRVVESEAIEITAKHRVQSRTMSLALPGELQQFIEQCAHENIEIMNYGNIAGFPVVSARIGAVCCVAADTNFEAAQSRACIDALGCRQIYRQKNPTLNFQREIDTPVDVQTPINVIEAEHGWYIALTG